MKWLTIMLLIQAFSIISAVAEVEAYYPLPLLYEIELRFVVTETTDGERANDLGATPQRAYINAQMDKILAQFGARVKFPSSDSTWVNDYAYEGSAADTGSRTTDDLNWIFNNIPIEYYQPDDGVITVVFCERTPGFDYRGFYQANGYAYIGGNGITFFLGDGMLQNTENMDIVAAVLAHEIGHNLNLPHVNSQYNLMNPIIYKGYLERDQTNIVIDGRFKHGFFAQFGAPDLILDRSVNGVSLKYLRSAGGIEQLVTSTSLQPTSWDRGPSFLVHGVFISNSFSFTSDLQRFFRVESTAEGGMKTFTRTVSRASPPKDCESIGCGAAGFNQPAPHKIYAKLKE